MRMPKPVAVLVAAALTGGVLASGAPGASAVQVAHPATVSTVPGAGMPQVLDGIVNAVAQVGDTMVVGGEFTKVRARGTARS